ncbi:MAG: hypothetical protein PHD11_00070 [Bacteroidales bacterium]|nr:hypothetical protein [Bacteroidales bacterium]MDD4670563.1 hypothetical protein [Bacteroidales bacterium]
MEEKQLNEKESLEVISNMIKATQNRFTQNAGAPFLVWGYTTVLSSIAVWFAMVRTGNYWWNMLWFLIPIISFPVMMIYNRKQESGAKTYVDSVINKIWIVFGSVGFLVSLVAMFGGYINMQLPILFIVILLMGMGTTLTGMVMKFLPCTIGGALAILLSFLCLIVHNWNVCLIFAAVFVVMMVIPGHILNCKGKCDAKRA